MLKIYLLLFFCFSSFCMPHLAVNAQNFDFQLEEFLVIGQSKSNSTEYLFSGIRQIIGNQKGQILVSDASDNTIRVYDKTGYFIKKIGRRGRGPGDFMQVTHVELTYNNEIVVLDRYQNKVSFFDSLGNFDYSTLFASETMGTSHIFSTGVENIYAVISRDFLKNNDDGYLLHLYDSSFNEVQEKYLNVFEQFFDQSDPLHVHISQPPLYKATKTGKFIAVTPGVYTGTIYLINIHTNEEMVIGETISDFVKQYDLNLREKYRSTGEKGFVTSSDQSGRYFFKRKGSNFGLVGNDNFLLHFYGLFQGKEIIPYMNIFSSSGKLIANISLKNHNVPFISKEQTFSFIPYFLDKENNLYVSDYYYKGSYPAVRVFKTNLNELLDE